MLKRTLAIVATVMLSIPSVGGSVVPVAPFEQPAQKVVQPSNPFASCSQLSSMNKSQRKVISKSFEYGQPHDLGYTLAAIAWHETGAGKVLVNTRTHSYGVYQINLKTALSREKMANEGFNRNMIASKLVSDIEFAAKHALMEIRDWRKIRGKDNLTAVLASYNGGWAGPKITESQRYAEAVKAKIKTLKACYAEGGNDAPSGTSGQRVVQIQSERPWKLWGRSS